LDFCWGNGNDFLLWKRHSKSAPKVKLPEEIKNQGILDRFISINWEECDDRESKVRKEFRRILIFKDYFGFCSEPLSIPFT